MSHYADCESAINALFESALSATPDQAFEAFLAFAARFSNLSIYNTMLLRIQRPGAIAVATARKWKTVGRWPLPGARPLVVLQPFGPVKFVYELSDTEGREIPGEQASSLLATGRATGATYTRLCRSAAANGVRVIDRPGLGQLYSGFAQPDHRVLVCEEAAVPGAPRWTVVVNADHDGPTRFATLAHELGHVYCGHLGEHSAGLFPSRRGLSLAAREIEAEAVAWLVCRRNDVTTRSAQYLAHYARAVDLREISMYAIFAAANRVEARTPPDDGREPRAATSDPVSGD